MMQQKCCVVFSCGTSVSSLTVINIFYEIKCLLKAVSKLKTYSQRTIQVSRASSGLIKLHQAQSGKSGLIVQMLYYLLFSFALEPLLPKKLHTKSQDKLDRDEPERERKEKKKEKRNSKHQEIFDKEMKTTEIQLQPTEAVILSETVLLLIFFLFLFSPKPSSFLFSHLLFSGICCWYSWLKRRKNNNESELAAIVVCDMSWYLLSTSW